MVGRETAVPASVCPRAHDRRVGGTMNAERAVLVLQAAARRQRLTRCMKSVFFRAAMRARAYHDLKLGRDMAIFEKCDWHSTKHVYTRPLMWQ